MPHPIHLHPTAELAPRALLPGDPGRALLLAQALLDEPKMFNHNRGLWGYTGAAADGEPLTIQATGMGGPSAAVVVEELADLGVETVIRVGTCGAIAEGPALGDLLAVTEALATDGASRALGAAERVAADAVLTRALAAGAAHAGPVATTDVFYDPAGERHNAEWAAAGALAVEMEAAAILQVCERRSLRGACVLVVSDVLVGGRRRIDDEGLAAAGEAMGRLAAAVLAQG
jgi:uridine phosphorylase